MALVYSSIDLSIFPCSKILFPSNLKYLLVGIKSRIIKLLKVTYIDVNLSGVRSFGISMMSVYFKSVKLFYIEYWKAAGLGKPIGNVKIILKALCN